MKHRIRSRPHFKISADCDVQAERWYMKKRFKALKGVALVIHGLNLKPEKMNAIIADINEAGIDVLNVSLRGHGDNYVQRSHASRDAQRLESFMTVTYSLWLQEFTKPIRKSEKGRTGRGFLSIWSAIPSAACWVVTFWLLIPMCPSIA